MGVFGTGLYSGDFAMDLRSAISAVVRVPYDSDKLADILCESEPTEPSLSSAQNSSDEARAPCCPYLSFRNFFGEHCNLINNLNHLPGAIFRRKFRQRSAIRARSR